MGRPTQVLLFPTFMALVFLYRMFYEDRRSWVGLGVAVALQGWSYWFYGYFLVIFLTLISLCQWYRQGLDWRGFILDSLKSMMLCVVLIVPALLPIVLSAINGDVPGVGLERSINLAEVVEQLVHVLCAEVWEPFHPHPLLDSRAGRASRVSYAEFRSSCVPASERA